MTIPNETPSSDNHHSWFGTASFVVSILSWPPFWSGMYAWLDGYMLWRNRSGGIWGWFVRLADLLFNIGGSSSSLDTGKMSMAILAGLFLALVAMGLAGGSFYFFPRHRQGRAIFGLLLGAFVWLVWVAGYLLHFGIFE